MSDDGWTERERAALRALEGDVAPPPRLEARIVRALGRAGLLRRSRVPVYAVLFAAGLAAGLLVPRRDRPPSPRYVLLLESPPAAGDEPARVAAVVAWARAQREAGIALSGEKLADGGWQVTASGSAPIAAARLGGYFVVGAAGDAEALRVAGSHPVLGWGGRIVVRRVDEL
jgi:hypothetical protein